MFDESHGWFPHYGQAIVRRLFFFRRPTARNNLICEWTSLHGGKNEIPLQAYHQPPTMA